jgi:hypothetical protein
VIDRSQLFDQMLNHLAILLGMNLLAAALKPLEQLRQSQQHG